ncbi:MAG: hypothetical protein KatS3mg102_0512 [Planctomycetota bacterium]|nr:MAG: hypothetical protein KatS3mg102_0512 [Planctomycetota bacterium]
MSIDTSVPPGLPPRPLDAHKGMFGRVLVLGGSTGLVGAAALAAGAALRAGAGLVTVGCPRSVYPILAAKLTDAMTWPLPETEAGTLAPQALPAVLERLATGGADVVALGPGLGREPSTLRFARALIERLTCPWVADADALVALAEEIELLGRTAHPGILTPHPGEMARLAGASTAEVQRDRAATARAFAARFPAHVLVLKGRGTLVALGSEQRLWRCEAGNPGMATGGMGDVLTGVIAALLGQGLVPFEAARLGVWAHARAGDLGAEQIGQRGLLASDLLERLPRVLR